ncbi:MAG: cation diffusion facilitator family transporter, partial [Clostridia bacterium]|nr:cation diffusion facilitator family transporter [Clostridia bacterium]
MVNLLTKLFIKNSDDIKNEKVRLAYGIMMGIIGILVNVILSVFKLLVGSLTNSISITADAVNNLSDAASSGISLIGFKIASKPADPEHPFGHGRIEYISSVIVSFLILLMGFEVLKDSIDKIIN